MSHVPVVAIVGRPNVGKSSLFNALLKKRISIEEPTEGVTRDRVIRDLCLNGKNLQLVDTGGIGVVDRQKLEEDVGEQIEFALGSADMIVFVVDGQNDPTALDEIVAKKIHKISVPTLLVANKVDNETLEYEVSRFLKLGFGDVIAISVLHQMGLDVFSRALSTKLPFVKQEQEQVDIRLALAGRRNVGKSSLTNFLCGAKRVIVSDMAGTTRDAVDVHLTWGDLKVTLVDTAGLRKKNQTEDSIEFFSVNRTFGALYRSEIGILMVDVVQGISQVDQKLGRWFVDEHKPCIIVVNKWDLAEGEITKDEYDRYLADRLPGLSYAPVVYASVKEGFGVDQLYRAVEEMRRQMSVELSTNQINDTIHEAQQQQRPKSSRGAVPKLFYGAQIKTSPPTFLIFGKCIQGIDDGYCRYLSQYFRKKLDLRNMPMNFVFRNRTSQYK
jgi:GTP-binding protein